MHFEASGVAPAIPCSIHIVSLAQPHQPKCLCHWAVVVAGQIVQRNEVHQHLLQLSPGSFAALIAGLCL